VRTLLRCPAISRIGAALAALWLCSTGSAWAGGPGGGDVGSAQAMLGPSNGSSGICSLLGMTSCPQLPTLTQLVLQISALLNNPPDFVRSSPLGTLGICNVAGNLGFNVCSQTNAINAINPPILSTGGSDDQQSGNQQSGQSSTDLSGLSPLAFMGPTSGPGQARPVPAGTSGANSFFYAVATGSNIEPKSFSLLYDYPALTNATFTRGQLVAAISLPLQIFNPADGSERLVCGPQTPVSKTASCAVSLATLQVSAVCTGGTDCLAATITGDFSTAGTTETLSVADLGVKFGVTFGPSPNSSRSHAIFRVLAPLLVTGPATKADASACQTAVNNFQPDVKHCGNDPAYFGVVPTGAANSATIGSPTGINQVSGLPTAFSANVLGSAFKGGRVGIAPYAAPQVVGNGSASTFGFCASFLTNGTSAVHPAVAAFAAIATDGTTYVSSPIPPFTGLTLQCPF
jgi:hypothetical protein